VLAVSFDEFRGENMGGVTSFMQAMKDTVRCVGVTATLSQTRLTEQLEPLFNNPRFQCLRFSTHRPRVKIIAQQVTLDNFVSQVHHLLDHLRSIVTNSSALIL
jgi:hypothetical protein